MLQIGTLDRQYIIDVRCTNLNPLKPILEDPNTVLVGHNIKFEYKHLLNHNIKINNVYDTMIVEQILHNGLQFPKLGKRVNDVIKNYDGYSLEDLLYRYLQKQVVKTTRLEFVDIQSKPFTETQIKYGAEDIIFPLKIKELQSSGIVQKDVGNCVSLEMLFLLVVGDLEYKGMYFNQHLWAEAYDKNKLKFTSLQSELDNFVLFNYPNSVFVDKQLNLFSDELKCRIQWTSSKQVVGLFQYLDICPMEVSKSTGKLSPTVNASVLRANLNDIEDTSKKDLIGIYLQLKEAEQSITTFGIAFFKYVNPITNRLHSNYKQILNTGRISSSSPNLQNIPSKPEFRKAFDCADGYNIVNADYSGQEQIILANKSEDKDLQSFYDRGLSDMHSFIASKIYPELSELSLDEIKTSHKEKRQIAKAAGFAINYGGTGFTISKNLGIPVEQGDEVYTAYFKAFPNLKKYFNKVQKESLRRGYILIDPITGRKNWFTRPKNNKERGKIQRAALNFPIQGEAGGITKYAPILFRKWIMDNKLEDVIFITNIVHDEINVEVRSDYAQLAADNLELCMSKAADKWCKTIKLTADAVITKYWNH